MLNYPYFNWHRYGACPNCGACPCCGSRQRSHHEPWWWDVQTYGPWTVDGTTGTGSFEVAEEPDGNVSSGDAVTINWSQFRNEQDT